MAHDEKEISTERVTFIEMTDTISEVTSPPGVAGRLKMSGSKLYIDNGSAWDIVTSA